MKIIRRYRGHRIGVVRMGSPWLAIVHGHAGSIVSTTNLEGTSLTDALARAKWFIETRLAFRPASRYERMAGSA